MKTKIKAINPRLVLALGVAGVSCSALLVRLTTAAPAITAFYRLLITCLLLAPLGIKNRAEFRHIQGRDWLLCGLGGVFLSFHFVLWFTSLGWTSVSSSALLVNIHPLLVVTLGWVVFGEKFRSAALPWAGLALVGMVVLGWGDLQLGRTAITGNFLAAAGGIMIGCYYLVGSRVRPRVGIACYSLLVYGTSTVLLFFYNLAVANSFTSYPASDWLSFAALAVIPTIFGHTLLNWSLKYLPAGAVSISVLGEPVLATLLAIPILAEIPGPLQLVGGGLVMAGIAMFLRRS